MKKLFTCGFSIGLLIAACAVPPQSATLVPVSGPDLLDTPWDDRSVFKAGLVTSEQPVLDELSEASVYHIALNIEDDLDRVTGSEEIRYTNAEDVSLDEVHLRLFPNILGGDMTVSNLTVDGDPVTSRLEMQDSLLIVSLPLPLQPGQSAILKLDFVVNVPQPVELMYGFLAYFDGVLTLAHTYPMIAVYDDEGWNSEIPSQNGDVTYADTSFFLAKITAPQDVKLVASGQELGSTETGESQTLSVAIGPARDFYLVASREYREISRTLGEVTVRSFTPPGYEEGSQLALDTAVRALENFSEHYAPFPYSEFDIVAVPTSVLGIEYPAIVAITLQVYDLDEAYRGAPASIYLESTVAHEVGHQWFYNLVGNDQLDDPWLDESLTQFATLQYYEDEYGPNGEQGFRNSLEDRWENVDRADIPIGLPVAEYQGAEYGAIVYGRGPLFFIALREEMGTESFDAFLREYTQTLSWEIATPEVLQTLAEKHCGCELDDLFNEWVY